MVAAGVPVARVEVDKGGKIVVIAGTVDGSSGLSGDGRKTTNEWDELLDGEGKVAVRQ